MSTSIQDQELDQHFARVEAELNTQEVTECVPRSHFFQKADPVYYDFKNPNTFLLTWSLHDIPRRS